MTIHPYLIQRLKASPKSGMFKDNPFSFGGGLKNGGLSETAMDIIRPVFSFDYMGSSEFEFGAVPECFSRIVKSTNKWTTKTVIIKNVPIYVTSEIDVNDEVCEIVKRLSNREFHLKESCRLDISIESILKKEEPKIIGWVDIENDYFFTINKDTSDNMNKMFGKYSESINENQA